MNEKTEQPAPTKEELTALLWSYTEAIKAFPERLKKSVVCISITPFLGDIHLTEEAFKTLFSDWNVQDNSIHWTLTAELNGVRVLTITRDRDSVYPKVEV